MKGNFLEELVSEWYQYRNYFVLQNVSVGRRQKGGYDGELDIVAFSPAKKHLVHIEASMDTASWADRETKFSKKFKAGAQFIPSLFPGSALPKEIEQIALLEYASTKNHSIVGGGKILLVSELLNEIFADLRDKDIAKQAIPESFLVLRGFQFVASHRQKIFST
jgi:hypothetical protein